MEKSKRKDPYQNGKKQKIKPINKLNGKQPPYDFQKTLPYVEND